MRLLSLFRLNKRAWGIVAVCGVLIIGLAIWGLYIMAVPYNTSDPDVQAKLQQIKELRTQIARDEQVVNAYLSIGKIYQELGDPKRELKAYQQLAKARPLSSPPFVAMGQYYTQQKQYSLAEKNMLKAIANNPENVSIYQDLAFLYIYNLDGREASFEALILDKSQQYPAVTPNLIHTLAFYFREIGNKSKAIEYFNRLIELVPENASEWRKVIADINS